MSVARPHRRPAAAAVPREARASAASVRSIAPHRSEQVHRLRPVVGGVPEELRIEGRERPRPGGPPGARRRERRPGPRRGRAGRPSDDLGPQDGPHRAEGAEERRRRSTGRPGGRRRGRCASGENATAGRPILRPISIQLGSSPVSAQRRLEQQVGHPEGERHRGQADESPAERGQRRGRGLGGSGHEDRPILDPQAARRLPARGSDQPTRSLVQMTHRRRGVEPIPFQRQQAEATWQSRRRMSAWRGGCSEGFSRSCAVADRLAAPFTRATPGGPRPLDLGRPARRLALDRSAAFFRIRSPRTRAVNVRDFVDTVNISGQVVIQRPC